MWVLVVKPPSPSPRLSAHNGGMAGWRMTARGRQVPLGPFTATTFMHTRMRALWLSAAAAGQGSHAMMDGWLDAVAGAVAVAAGGRDAAAAAGPLWHERECGDAAGQGPAHRHGAGQVRWAVAASEGGHRDACGLMPRPGQAGLCGLFSRWWRGAYIGAVGMSSKECVAAAPTVMQHTDCWQGSATRFARAPGRVHDAHGAYIRMPGRPPAGLRLRATPMPS